VLLFTGLFAVQAAFLTVAPILPALSREFGISTAAGGQLRAVSGLAGVVAAVVAIAVRRRAGVQRLLTVGLSVLAIGSLASAVAPSFQALAAAQVPLGAGLALVLGAGLAAAAEWSAPDDRSRVLAWTLLGQPGAWVAGMPLIGLVADVDWRLAWAVPFTAAICALAGVGHRSTGRVPRPTEAAAPATSIWRRPDVVGWALGELFAFTAWSGVLVYIGALLIESYGLSAGTTGVALGAAAAAYFPATLVARRHISRHARPMLMTLGLTAAAGTALLGAFMPGAVFSIVLFAAVVAAMGARTLAASAFGLQSAGEERVAIGALRAAVTQVGYLAGAAVGGAALAAGGHAALTTVLALAGVLAVVPHVVLMLGRKSESSALTVPILAYHE
jgi:MFS transporter, DHA1 family, inner membrane transport protein